MKEKVNIKKLLSYGFIKKDNYYYYEDILLENKFKIIVIFNNDLLDAKVIDINTLEEYILVKLKDINGEYVGKIRDLYLKKLADIKSKCFEKELFKFKQTKDVVKYLQTKYNVTPEFLWDDDVNAAIRNKDNLKWFGIIMTVAKEKLGLESKELVEIIDLKIDPKKIENLVDNKKYFRGYHMNKKYWLTIILDESTDNKIIFDLIDESYNATKKG